jgi:flagellin-like hook-associated protein FlgL
LSAVASELNRIDQEIEKLEEREVQNIAAIGKIVDTDMAADATELAKSKIRSDLAASCISKSIGINDALIPLTTKHYRGAILKT